MSRLSTRIFKPLYLMIVLVVTVVFPASAFAQTVDIRVDGDDGLAVPVPPEGDTWGNAYKYLQDAIAQAKLLLIADPNTPVQLWVAETDVTNPYVPDRDAANPDGTGLRTSTFLLDFNDVQVLGGFVGNEIDVDDRDPLNIITVLSGDITVPLPPAVCGDPDAGDCFQDNGTPGCNDATCCEAVCTVIPDCCEVEWDQDCADFANDVCDHCGVPGSGSCFEPNGSPGCEDPACCAFVCDMDPGCCTNGWDEFCADFAIANCAMSDNAYHVVTAQNVDSSVQIDGFTITGGFADTTALTARGGGMLLIAAPPGFTSDPVILRCMFIDNFAVEGGGLSGSPGFGLATQPQIVNCSFIENVARTNGGAAHAVRSTLSFVNCLFVGNVAEEGDGGAIFDGFSGGPTNTEAINCTLTENAAPNGDGGGIFSDSQSSATVTNSIAWANSHSGSGDETAQIFGTATVTYSCIQDESPGDGNPPFGDATNVDLDPLFVDPVNGDYRLMVDSPCIDVGNTSIIPCDQFDLDNDGITCDEMDPDFYEPTPDLDLGDRVVDGDEISGADVDMGAYEFVPCPWDLNGDCVVGAADLLELLFTWGPCDDCDDCPADFDGTCAVGANDLLVLLFNWGPCYCAEAGTVVPSLEDELDDACLTQDDWDEFEAVMTDPNSSQEDKDRYNCWMTHYLFHCNKCTCEHRDHCPDPDPFSD